MVLYDPFVWGPHFWFFLDTVAMTYPNHPNAVTKKIYYDLFQNFHLFIPVKEHSNSFNKLLSIYPITPYLDNRESLVRWCHFIHNKINDQLDKPKMTYHDFFSSYYGRYKESNMQKYERNRFYRKIMYLLLLSIVILLIVYLFKF